MVLRCVRARSSAKNLETIKLSLLSQQRQDFQCLVTVYVLVSYQSLKPFLLLVQYYGKKRRIEQR